MYEDGSALISIDRHLVHELTSPHAVDGLKFAVCRTWRINANLAQFHHNVATDYTNAGVA